MVVMTDVIPRSASRVRRDFPEPGNADALIGRLAAVKAGERVQAAVALWARGEFNRFDESLVLCEVDWRDVLVRGGLADEDWPERLDAELGSGS
jgi:hypothetical protein